MLSRRRGSEGARAVAASLALVLALLPIVACHDDYRGPVQPENPGACSGVNLRGTFSNAEGAATLLRLRASTDEGDAVDFPSSGAVASIPVSVTFKFRARGSHTVFLTVVDQTVSPSPYRFSDVFVVLTLDCNGSSASGSKGDQSATLATGASISYTFDF